MAQALYRKWRPQTFEDVIGQDHIVRTLRQALRTGRMHHAYLLVGPRGTGKTTTARLIAKAINCLADAEQRPCGACEMCRAVSEGRLMDLVEIDAASHTGVDNIRDLLEKVTFRPTQAQFKVYVIDEVHMLSTSAFNALLKTLEEPPEHVVFIMATTEVHKVPDTILSRCQRFEYRRIPLAMLVEQMQKITTTEGIPTEPAALDLIARAATGSMRDAISLLDQMASAGGEVTADYVRLMLGAERREVVRGLLEAWVEGDLNGGMEIINRAVDGGADPRQLARQTANFMRGLLLIRLGAGETWTDPTDAERPFFIELAKKTQPHRLVEAVRLFSAVAADNRRAGWQPQLPLELAFVEATLEPEPPPQPVMAAPAPVPAPTAKAVPTATATTPARPVRSVKPRPQRAASAAPAPRPAADSRSASPAAPAARAATLDAALVQRIQNHWREAIKHVQPVSLGALLRDAEAAGVDHDGKLVLAFQHTFHCERVAQDANQRTVEGELSRLFKQPLTVRCMLAKDWKALAAPTPAPAASPTSTTPPPPEPPPDEEDELIQRAQEELGAVPRTG